MASHIVYDAIRAKLEDPTAIAALADPVTLALPPFRWENDTFEVPENGTWIAVEMTGTLYGQESMGASVQANNRWDEEGILWLHVNVSSGSGAREARRVAKAAADVFRGLTLVSGSLEFLDAFIGRGIAGEENGNWYKIIVHIQWRRVEA